MASAGRLSAAQGAFERLAGDRHVVERDLPPPSNSWPCSWPLPAITTTSPGRAPAIASGSRSPAIDVVLDAGAGTSQDLPDDRLRILRAGIVGGDDHAVGQANGDLPHERALAPVAISAAAEHHVSRPPWPASSAPGRLQHVLERIRGVRVVDKHRELLAGVDRLKAPRDVAGGLDRAGRDVDRDAEPRAAANAPEHVVHVEAPGSGELQRDDAVGVRRP